MTSHAMTALAYNLTVVGALACAALIRTLDAETQGQQIADIANAVTCGTMGRWGLVHNDDAPAMVAHRAIGDAVRDVWMEHRHREFSRLAADVRTERSRWMAAVER